MRLVQGQTYSGGWQDRLVIADDGDINIAQRLGVGGTHSDSYQLYVNGTSYFGNVAHIRYTASGSLTVPLTIENNGIAASTAVGINFKTYDRYSRIKSERTGQNEGTDLVFEVDGTASGQGYTQALRLKESGQITFANAYTFPTSIGSAGQVLKVPSSGITLEWDTLDWEDMPNISTLDALP